MRRVNPGIASFTPARIARRSNSLSDDVKLNGNQLFAWTEPDRLDELSMAYKSLVERAPITGKVFTNSGECTLKEHWTIEPVSAGILDTHTILRFAGFQAYSQGFFDDGELKLETVMKSVLYKTL